MTAYAEIKDGAVIQQFGRVDPVGFVGPEGPLYAATEGCTYRKLAADIVWSARPSASHRLMWPDLEAAPLWVETLTLAELKVRKRAQITADRLAADADKFVYQTKQIRTAEKDIFDLLIADARMKKGWPPNWPGGWKAMDDTYLMISTIAEWDAFFIAMYDAGIANFQKSQNLKADISAATTPEQVAAINWNNQPTGAV